MKLEHEFSVEAEVGDVWAALTDLERVAPCLPGAEITEVAGDGAYRGAFSVRLGPATATYDGVLRMESLDKASWTTVIGADGQDKRGQGGAKARITTALRPDETRTNVEVITDLTITGRLARVGRASLMQDVSNRLMTEFSHNLQSVLLLLPPQPSENTSTAAASHPDGDAPTASVPLERKPVRALSLVWAVLVNRMRRIARRRGS